jgi:hypothetical protein
MNSKPRCKTACYPIFSDEDADLRSLLWRTWSDGYATRKFRGTTRTAHRVVLSRKLGRDLEPGECCDHINFDILDNRRENLRLATVAQNNLHRRGGRGVSGVRGVSPCGRSSWCARVKYRGRHYYVGTFKTIAEAAEAARRKRLELGFPS